ncbi:MAG: YbhB/YbcL family Raf kinase inhibitor-like protein [Chloroflexi bacterium]|nr:YbhB/YbcL family Raf kinase inhibitor-like protein [Chloroflexota bacterium]
MTIEMTSPSFTQGGKIPGKFTCDGDDVSPALQWSTPPTGVRSYVLIMDDPDAPMGTFVHWVLYNIPGESTALPEAVARTRQVTGIGEQGINSARQTGYFGPCPPGGTHRYYFKLYALDARLAPAGNPTAADLVKAMQGHILAEAQLMGRYTR